MTQEQNRSSSFPCPVIRMKRSQMVSVNRVYGQIFYATDEGRMYVDTIDGGRVYDPSIVVLRTESERLNISHPESYVGNRFYVVETNILFKYLNGSWRIERGRLEREVAQTYYPDGKMVRVYNDDVSNNGILGDGSVVVRDENRTIVGILSATEYSLNVNSLAGCQINLNPSAVHQGKGSLVLNADLYSNDYNNNTALYNGDLYVFGTINKIAPEKWNNRFRVLQEVVLIDSESILKKGSYIEVGSIIGSTEVKSNGITLTEDITITTGTLTSGTKLSYGSTVNGTSTRPPYVFDLSQSASIPDFQSVDSSGFVIEDETLTLTEARDLSLGSELYLDLSHLVSGSHFKKIVANGKPFEIVGDTEVNSSEFALIKVVTTSQFIILKKGD